MVSLSLLESCVGKLVPEMASDAAAVMTTDRTGELVLHI